MHPGFRRCFFRACSDRVDERRDGPFLLLVAAAQSLRRSGSATPRVIVASSSHSTRNAALLRGRISTTRAALRRLLKRHRQPAADPDGAPPEQRSHLFRGSTQQAVPAVRCRRPDAVPDTPIFKLQSVILVFELDHFAVQPSGRVKVLMRAQAEEGRGRGIVRKKGVRRCLRCFKVVQAVLAPPPASSSSCDDLRSAPWCRKGRAACDY